MCRSVESIQELILHGEALEVYTRILNVVSDAY